MSDFLSSKTGKILLLVTLVCVAMALTAYFLGIGLWIWPALVVGTILVSIVLWLLVDLVSKAVRKKREENFDAGVAAKEGIDDRRREWANWTAELRKQGIDRYALPMYLLVGEPQSGKSVMLQNSDLHFPFGQSRLSGVGGTRGCDWWFTEEAVILDLAGRLFTHEGGASDEAEWGAFLDLLSKFRPLCPANGILLVLPCDSLLKDSESQAVAKANRMQGALLTLTSRIQARLPVYVVLTKGDKIFGFAECVHRLDAEQRHQMFGWSRTAEKAEAPFEAGEVQLAFDGLVERARLLRAQMLAGARIPEALPEVDRLYAFPNEFAALWPGISTYLQRIFSDTQLVDRLFFRGLYLTSGLQSGAPIAKVCGDLLGAPGEADRRNLEALFTKQRAFFIKDLVRKRVFSERGIVRPTRARVVKARRAAIIAYSLAATIALASITWTVVYVLNRERDAEIAPFDHAILGVDEILEKESPELPEYLDGLDRLEKAVAHSAQEVGDFYESTFWNSTAAGFKGIYGELFDRRVFPELRRLATKRVAARRDPESYASFLEQLEDVAFLAGPIDLNEEEQRARFVRLAGAEGDAPAEPDPKAPPTAKSVEKILADRLELAGSFDEEEKPPEQTGDLRIAIDAAIQRWDGVLTPGKAWTARGDGLESLGYMLAFQGLVKSYEELLAYQPGESGQDVMELCRRMANSREILAASQGALPQKDGVSKLQNDHVQVQISEVDDERKEFLTRVGRESEASRWGGLDSLKPLTTQLFKNKPQEPVILLPGIAGKAEGGLKKLVGGKPTPTVNVPPKEVKDITDDSALNQASDPRFLADPDPEREGEWARGLPDQLAEGAKIVEKGAGTPAGKVFLGKSERAMQRYLELWEGGDWKGLAVDLVAPRNLEGTFSKELSDHLARMGAQLTRLRPVHGRLSEWGGRVEALSTSYEAALLEGWRRPSTSIQTTATELRSHLQSLKAAGGPDSKPPHKFDEYLAERIKDCGSRLQAYWGALPPEIPKDTVGAAAWFLDQSDRDKLRDRIEGIAGDPNVAGCSEIETLPTDILGELSAKAMQDLKEFAKPTLETLTNSEYTRRLRGVATKFRDDARIKGDGPAMADLLGSSDEAIEHKPKDAGGQYVGKLFGAFKERALAEIHKEFLKDFTRQLGDFQDVIDALWGKPISSASSLPDRLGRVFDHEGVLWILLKSYRIRTEVKAADDAAKQVAASEWSLEEFFALGSGSEMSPDDTDALRCAEFLVKLQGFLLGGDENKKRVSASKTTVQIASLDDPDSLWNKPNDRDWRSNFFLHAPSLPDGYEWIAVMPQKPIVVRPVIWGFGPGSEKGMAMAWSKVNTNYEGVGAGDYREEFPGPLAPLVMAWRGQRDVDRWKLSFVPKGASRPATFTITFTPLPLPPRPERIPNLHR